MRVPTTKEIAVFAFLVAAGVTGRLACVEIPNFQPTAAVALFAGFYFASRRLAVGVPLGVMAISNLWLDPYQSWAQLIIVYGAFLCPVWLGRRLLRGPRVGLPAAVRWGVCLAAPSLLFFLTTNFGVWLFSGMYPPTAAGLGACYALAIPFYGYSLAGDLVFGPLLFGAYQLGRAAAGQRWGMDPVAA